jgi:EAL domain-containing protein (putative c-di-GMP-specific phosphodiesterase class I)
MIQEHDIDGLPSALCQRGMLYLSTPMRCADAELRRLLAEHELPCREPHPQVLAVHLSAGKLGPWCADVARQLSERQLHETRYCLVEGKQPLTPAQLMRTNSLGTLIARWRGDWLVGLLRQRRLTIYFQPIVRTCDPQQVYAYECLVRARQDDGQLIYPDRLFQAARSANLLHRLDYEARLTAIEASVRAQIESNIFINFNPSSINESQHLLDATRTTAEESGIPHERFVFEVVESEEIRDTQRLLAIINQYRDCGFRVALDDLGSGYSSLNLLTRLQPDFVKLDMQLIRGIDSDPFKSRVAGKLLEMAQHLRIQTVVEGVETVAEWQWAAQHGADFAQGYLFARPAAAPPKPSRHLPPLAIGASTPEATIG